MLKIFRMNLVPHNSVILFSLFFVLFKALTFFVPLLLLNQLSHSDYIIIESGLAISNIVVILLNLGVSAAVPLYLLKENKKSDVSYIYFHCIVVASLMLLVALICHFLLDSPKIIFICLVVSLLCNLRVIASHKKTLAQPIQASFFETFVFVVLSICIIIGFIIGEINLLIINLCLAIATIYVVTLAVAEALFSENKLIKCQFSKLKELYSFSAISLLSGIAIILIITLIRALGDGFLTDEEYLSYSTYFRYSSITIIAFQFTLTLKFKDIYESSEDYLDRKSCQIICLVLFLGLCLYHSQSSLFPLLFNYDIQLILGNHNHVFFPVILAMPLWAVSAILENIIARERAFKSMLIYLGILFSIFSIIVLVLLYINKFDFIRMLYFHIILLVALVSSQLLALSKLGIKLIRIRIVVIVHLILGVLGASLSS